MPEVIKTILTADSSELRSEFAKASAVVTDYQAKQQAGFDKALAGHQLEIRALGVEAAGLKALASNMRETAALREQAVRLAASAGITEKAALGILEEKLRLHKSIAVSAAQEATARQQAASRAAAIANPRASGLPGGGGGAPLTSQSLAMLDRTIASQRELRRQTLLAGQSGKNGALGFLAFSQAVEDAQYGIKGVLNNIPQMVMGFGGSVGLAGALSLAAVASALLYPKLKDLYGAADNERLKAANAEWGKIFTSGMKAALDFEKAVKIERELVGYSAQIGESLRQRLGLISQMSNYWDEELTAKRNQRDAEREILEARMKLAEARGQSPSRSAAVLGAAENGGMSADLVNRQKEYARVQAEVLRLGEVARNVSAESAAKEQSDTARLILLKKELAGAEANIAEYKKANEGASAAEIIQNTRSLGASAKRRNAIQAEIEQIEKFGKTRKEKFDEEIRQAKQQIDALDTKSNKTKEETEALAALIKQRRELQQIEAQTAAAIASQKGMDDFNEQRKKDEAAYQEAVARGEAGKKERQAREAAGADFGTQVRALQLELSGRKDLADHLRKEMEMRTQAVTLAKQLGISEEDALRKLRLKARLQEQLDGGPGGRRPRGIRRLDNGARDFNAGNNLNQWQWRLGQDSRRIDAGGGRRIGAGVRDTELRRRAGERANSSRQTDPSIRLLEDSKNLQEQMLKVFQSIGAV